MKRKIDPVSVRLENGNIKCGSNNILPSRLPQKCKVLIQQQGDEVIIIAFFGKIQCGSEAEVFQTDEEVIIKLPVHLQLPAQTRSGTIHQVRDIEGAFSFVFPPLKAPKK